VAKHTSDIKSIEVGKLS